MKSGNDFEFIVIGSGAGGGPVAANLAKAGRRVLVLEAGGNANNPLAQFKYHVPGNNPRSYPELGWAYWVNSRANQADREKQHFYVPGKGLYYPRGTSIGGSTTVNAMIALYPDNSDWDHIAELTGDSSWNSVDMRKYFDRLLGWLPLEKVGVKKNLCKDKWLANYIASRVQHVEGGDEFMDAVKNGKEFDRNPNDLNFVNKKGTGMADPPRTSENGERRGTRELLLKTAAEFPQYLTIQTDCLVTSLLFDDNEKNKCVGVEYMQGPHLYGASLLAEEFGTRTGIKRQAFARNEVIVSAGAFNSPQILMLSGIGAEEDLKKHGIAVRVNLPGVGKNLQDRLETGVVCKLPFQPNIYNGCTWGALGDPCLLDFESGRPDAEYRTRLSRQMYMIMKSSPDREVPNLVIFGFTGTFRGYYYPSTDPVTQKDTFTWFTLSGHRHQTGGTVMLKSANPRDTPEINFNNFEDGNDEKGEDLEALLRGVKMARKMAANGAEGVAEGEISPGVSCESDDDLRKFIKNEAWGHHASCTNKMGPEEDPMAVVDSRFRVHNTKGLRIVDASVFPKLPGLFIVVPIYMIAEKASDIILADNS
jgi:choline dehydrogenase